MNEIPQDWIRGPTSTEEILADWNRRRKIHEWWTPPTHDWIQEWESFTATNQEGDQLHHFSECANQFPTEKYGDEGYLILRAGIQIRSIFWVSETKNDRAGPEPVPDAFQ